MKYLSTYKLFENNDSDTLMDLFLDVKDKYSLTEIESDPFQGRGSYYWTKEMFPPGNSYYVRQSTHLLQKEEENGFYGLVILIPLDINLEGHRVSDTSARSLLINHIPEFLHDIGQYEKSVDSFTKMLGYRARPSEMVSLKQCRDFSVIEFIITFRVEEYKETSRRNTEKFLTDLLRYDDDTPQYRDLKDKLRKLGYNIPN